MIGLLDLWSQVNDSLPRPRACKYVIRYVIKREGKLILSGIRRWHEFKKNIDVNE